MAARLSIEEYRSRVLAQVVAGAGGCWLYQGRLNADGYGVGLIWDDSFSQHQRHIRLHRFIYEQFVGPIPEGLHLDHLCRVRHCVNPAHLEPVTNGENALRGESFSAKNARKTHCPQGHEYTPENTIFKKNGRNCRACHRETSRTYRERQKASAA